LFMYVDLGLLRFAHLIININTTHTQPVQCRSSTCTYALMYVYLMTLLTLVA